MVRRLRTPFSAAARERRRVRLITGMITGYSLFAVFVYFLVYEGMQSASFATSAAAYVSLTGAASWGFLAYELAAPYRSRPGWQLAFGVLVGSAVGVMAWGDDHASWHLKAPVAVAVSVCAALASGVIGTAYIRAVSRRALRWSKRRPADRRAAPEMYEAILSAGKARGRSEEEQGFVRMNRSHAAVVWSYGDDSRDGLVEATEELHCLLVSDPPDDWLVLLSAARDLVRAFSTKAGKHGDLSGYSTALDLLTDVARRMPPDAGSMAVVHSARAEYLAIVAGRLPPGPEGDGHAAEAVAAARAAIAAVTPPMRGLLPELHADLGLLLAHVRADPGDLEAGIAECRSAARLARRSPRARAYAWRALAALLVDYAEALARDLPEQVPDAVLAATASAVGAALAEAERIVRWARWCGGYDGRLAGWRLLAQVRTARAAILGGGSGQDRQAALAWRHAARAAAGSDPLDQVQIGQEWVDWAQSTQYVMWCAEAYWYLMSAVPRAVAVRYLAGERDRILADLQSTAEEAGYWLARARPGDAAVALELGRAVSLSEVLGRERPGLAALLTQASRPDLLERYQQALEAYSAATASSVDGNDLTSAAQRAWTSYDTVVREIAAVADIDMPSVRLAPAELAAAELAAAAAEGPVVYLAAAAGGGYAIIVPAAAPPTYLPLPELTRTEAADLAESFPREAEPDRMKKITVATRRLWTAGIGMLASDLPAGALVTLIPVGLLSLLPVHAAGGPAAPGQAPDDWDFLADRVTVRYAPNARTLLGTRHRAGALTQAPLTLLAAAAPDGGDQQQSLPYTVREVTEITQRWTQAKLITDGASALRELGGDYTVWHLACHCWTVPEHILDSALLLSDAQVTLREILVMRSVPRRLAVLSACNTHVSGTELPDEVMGLPAGLLHAGFAGVVASHWVVNDRSTPFLMTRFHDLWHGQGLPPAVALAEAQRWLRRATRADLNAYLDGILAPPADWSTDGLADWEAVRPYGHPYHWAPFALTGH